MTMHQSQNIQVNGLTLHTLSWNREERTLPLIVLFHGWLDHAATWIDCMNHIANAGYRVMIPEQRGHGHSAHLPSFCHYHFPDYVADMQAFVDANVCSDTELYVIGHSMGGSIATLLCGVGAISAHALILIEGLGPAHEPPHAAFARYQTHLEQRRKPRKAKPMASVEEAAARIQRLNPKLSNDRARQFAKYITKESEDGLVWAWDPRHRDKAPIGYDAARYQHVFQKLQLPTHLIWGAESWYLTLPDLQSRIDCLPNIHSQHTLNTGHSPHYEQPAVLAETLLACLGRNS